MVQEETQIPGSSKAAKPSPEEMEQIDVMMSEGKKHLICDQPQLALDVFVELCEKMTSHYGQLGDQCAEAYLYYGKTLLEMARMENGVLGHAVKETPIFDEPEEQTEDADDEETKKEREKIRADVEHSMRGGNIYNDASTEEESEAEEDPNIKKDENPEEQASSTTEQQTATSNTRKISTDSSTQTAEQSTEASSSSKQPEDAPGSLATPQDVDMEEQVKSSSTDGQEEQEGAEMEEIENNEDATDIQLAWEMFELAVFICKRQIKKGGMKPEEMRKAKEMIAEAKYGLGQVSLESENYSQAIPDFQECLKSYKDILDENDRRIAEVYYNIGLTLSYDKQYEEAIVNYQQAVDLLKERIKCLESKVTEAKEKGSKEKISTEVEEWEKEITELNDLVLLDMMAKIEDAQEMQKQLNTARETMREAAKEILSAVGTSNGFDQGFDEGFDAPTQCEESTTAVHDITSKVRSVKRKPEDEAPTVIDAKKMKSGEQTKESEQNGHVNGHRETNGHTNGDINGHVNGHPPPEQKEIKADA